VHLAITAAISVVGAPAGGALSKLVGNGPERLVPPGRNSCAKIICLAAAGSFTSLTEGRVAGHRGPMVRSTPKPIRFASDRMVSTLATHFGVPNPYVSRKGFWSCPAPATPKAAISAPPPPASRISPNSATSSASSVYAKGNHQRYFGRAIAGGSANNPFVSRGASSTATDRPCPEVALAISGSAASAPVSAMTASTVL